MEQMKEPMLCAECGEQIKQSYMLECEYCLSKKKE